MDGALHLVIVKIRVPSPVKPEFVQVLFPPHSFFNYLFNYEDHFHFDNNNIIIIIIIVIIIIIITVRLVNVGFKINKTQQLKPSLFNLIMTK